MDRKALYDLSYGVFLLSAKAGDRVNGCITNTCIQVASSPVRVAFSVLNGNLTCEVLKEGGVFCLTVLDQSVTPETIRHFGAQSGRDVDKFSSFRPAYDENGVPYLPWQSCARLSGRVVSRQDLGSHTLFVAELEQAQVLSDREPLTYAYYQRELKPKPAQAEPERRIVGWRCRICGFVYDGPELPADYLCPLCGHPAEDFEPIYAE